MFELGAWKPDCGLSPFQPPPQPPLFDQRVDRRNHSQRQHGAGDHAADHGRGDAAHDFGAGSCPPHNGQEACHDGGHNRPDITQTQPTRVKGSDSMTTCVSVMRLKFRYSSMKIGSRSTIQTLHCEICQPFSEFQDSGFISILMKALSRPIFTSKPVMAMQILAFTHRTGKK